MHNFVEVGKIMDLFYMTVIGIFYYGYFRFWSLITKIIYILLLLLLILLNYTIYLGYYISICFLSCRVISVVEIILLHKWTLLQFGFSYHQMIFNSYYITFIIFLVVHGKLSNLLSKIIHKIDGKSQLKIC